MPIFDLKCTKCKKELKDHYSLHWDDQVLCPRCGMYYMQKIPSRFFADTFPAEGIFLEHVSSEGKRFYSKKEMRQYAKEHDLELGAL
jgi:putative FmdB family regulatory protein